MCSLVVRRFVLSIIFLLTVQIVGCHNEAPVPASSHKEVPSTSATVVEDSVPQDTPFELEPEFTLLTRDQFISFQPEPETWTVTDDGIASSGKPRGYLYSQQPYENFTLRLEYRFPRPKGLKDDSKFKGNTGFLVYINGEHKLWPICVEIQGKYLQMAAIKENGGADPVIAEDDDAARQKARKPVGQWNSLEIISKAGALQVILNGTPISNSQPGLLKSGLIGIQAEDHPFEVRRMRIRSE